MLPIVTFDAKLAKRSFHGFSTTNLPWKSLFNYFNTYLINFQLLQCHALSREVFHLDCNPVQKVPRLC